MKYNGMNLQSGLFYAGEDEERYKDSLKLFYNTSKAEEQRLSELLEEENAEYFIIKIHSLKGLAKAIGADKLFQLASEIEDLSMEKGLNSITNLWKNALTEWNNVLEFILDYVGEEYLQAEEATESNGIRPDIQTITAKCADIISALNDFDIDKSEELLVSILKYELDDDIRLLLLKGLFKTRDFEYRKAVKQVSMALELFTENNKE